MPAKTEQTEAFWQSFVESGAQGADYAVVALGDSPKMATELAALVVSGAKRATCSLARDYAGSRVMLPEAGDFVVVVDGNGTPHLADNGGRNQTARCRR